MNRLMKFFTFKHLPLNLQSISETLCATAMLIDTELQESAEKTAGMRKLLEAKDCFVRAKIEEIEDRG